MKRLVTRLAGLALITAAIAGLILCVLGLIVVDRVAGQVESAVNKQFDLVDRALVAMSSGLATAETSLTQAVGTVEAVEDTMADMGKAIDDTVPTIDAVGKLLGEKLPRTLATTQQTLTWLGSSAKTVDDIMTVITAIPLLGLHPYNPEMPLEQGFERVARSLDGIPESLGIAQQGLVSTSENLAGIETDVTTMAAKIGQITTSLKSAQSVVVQYEGIVADLQAMISSFRASLPGWLRWLRWGLWLLLIWLGITQLGLLTQGWELVARSRRPR